MMIVTAELVVAIPGKYEDLHFEVSKWLGWGWEFESCLRKIDPIVSTGQLWDNNEEHLGRKVNSCPRRIVHSTILGGKRPYTSSLLSLQARATLFRQRLILVIV